MWHQIQQGARSMQHEPMCCPHLVLWLIGALIGVGQLLLGEAELKMRRAVGRALVSGGIASSAGAVLVWIPDLSPTGMIGVAAALASLGTSGLERLVDRAFGDRRK